MNGESLTPLKEARLRELDWRYQFYVEIRR